MASSFKTADGRYDYHQKCADGKTLYEHSLLMNEHITKLNGWRENSEFMNEGKWGAEINICRIGNAVHNRTYDNTINEIAAAVHDGWSECYRFWYENKPWLWKDSRYIKGQTDMYINDKYKRSKLKFDELLEKDKVVYRQMAAYIKDNCMIKS